MKAKRTKQEPETIGQRIRAERERLGWSHMDLATAIKSDPRNVAAYESGKKGVGRIVGERICGAFGWTLDRLFRGISK